MIRKLCCIFVMFWCIGCIGCGKNESVDLSTITMNPLESIQDLEHVQKGNYYVFDATFFTKRNDKKYQYAFSCYLKDSEYAQSFFIQDGTEEKSMSFLAELDYKDKKELKICAEFLGTEEDPKQTHYLFKCVKFKEGEEINDENKLAQEQDESKVEDQTEKNTTVSNGFTADQINDDNDDTTMKQEKDIDGTNVNLLAEQNIDLEYEFWGFYTDNRYPNCYLCVSPIGDSGVCNIEVVWEKSIDSTQYWSLEGVHSDGKLTYSGIVFEEKYGDDGPRITEQHNASGYFFYEKNGAGKWSEYPEFSFVCNGNPHESDCYMKVIASDGYVNLREGAGTEYDVIMQIPTGALLVAPSYSSDKWVSVYMGDQWGYVATSQVEPYTGSNNQNNYQLREGIYTSVFSGDYFGLNVLGKMLVKKNEYGSYDGILFIDKSYIATGGNYIGESYEILGTITYVGNNVYTILIKDASYKCSENLIGEELMLTFDDDERIRLHNLELFGTMIDYPDYGYNIFDGEDTFWRYTYDQEENVVPGKYVPDKDFCDAEVEGVFAEIEDVTNRVGAFYNYNGKVYSMAITGVGRLDHFGYLLKVSDFSVDHIWSCGLSEYLGQGYIELCEPGYRDGGHVGSASVYATVMPSMRGFGWFSIKSQTEYQDYDFWEKVQ